MENEKNSKMILSSIRNGLIKSKGRLIFFALAGVLLFSLVGLTRGNEAQGNEEKTPENQCSLIFDSTGGSAVEEMVFECGVQVSNPRISPTKEGYDFLGWYHNDTQYTFEQKVVENIILIAKYQVKESIETVVVSYDSDGGTIVSPVEIMKGTIVSKPLIPSKEGFTFVAWHYQNERFDFSKPINENMKLKAVWKKVAISNNSGGTTENPNGNETSNNQGNVDLNACVANFSSVLEERNVTTDYKDHYNRTFSGASYSPDACKLVFRSSNQSVAIIDSDGIIDALNKGTTVISSCLVDVKTNKEIGCNNGKLTVNLSNYEAEKELAVEFGNAVNGHYWYLDGAKYAYLQPNIKDWYGHKMLDWDSKYIAMVNNQFVTSETTGQMYNDDSNLHNEFLSNPYELGYHTIQKYNMKVSGSKLYMTFGGKSYSFTKRTTKVEEKVTLSLSKTDLSLNEGASATIRLAIAPKFFDHNINVQSSSPTAICQSGAYIASEGYLDFDCIGIDVGQTTITFQDSVGGSTVSLQVSVNRVSIPVQGVTLSHSSLDLIKDTSTSLSASVIPSNATNKTVTWSSSNPAVAIVSTSGEVTAVGVGTTIIRATTQDGLYTTECVVIVKNPVLSANAGAGITNACTTSGCGSYTYIYVNPVGGSGNYTFAYDVYKDGVYVGSYNTKETYLPLDKGTYQVNYRVTDSEGTTISGTSTTTITF